MGVPLNITSLSGWSISLIIFLVIVRAFIRGDIVPRSVLNDVRADRDARLVEIGAWREAFDEQSIVLRKLTEQNAKLAALSEVTASTLESLPDGTQEE